VLNNVWYKKHAPVSFDDYVFKDETLRRRFNSYKEQGSIPNVLLAGEPGTGKSSLAYTLFNELGIEESDILVLNGTTIKQDHLKEDGDVAKFCSTMPASSPFKVVLFEEFDRGERGRNALIQDSMRHTIDRYGDAVAFVFTCNYISKVSEPIKSRCEVFEFAFDGSEEEHYEHIATLVYNVLQKENIECDPDTLFDHVFQNYPDIRKTLVSVQMATKDGALQPPDAETKGVTEASEEWKNIWSNDGFDLWKLEPLVEHITNENKDEFYRAIYENINQFPDDHKETIVVMIADHLYRSSFVADQELMMKSLLYSIKQEFLNE